MAPSFTRKSLFDRTRPLFCLTIRAEMWAMRMASSALCKACNCWSFTSTIGLNKVCSVPCKKTPNLSSFCSLIFSSFAGSRSFFNTWSALSLLSWPVPRVVHDREEAAIVVQLSERISDALKNLFYLWNEMLNSHFEVSLIRSNFKAKRIAIEQS